MIQELTKENLQKLGFKEADVNKLYNTIDTYNLQCSEGKVFVSKIENKIYTGIDFYRKTCLNKGSLCFPSNYPDLVNEYFDLALVEFLEKQKTVLGLLFNEEDQFNKFKSNEIKSMQIKIEGHKEFLLKMKYHKCLSKENDIQIWESYINYLNNKHFLKEKINTTNPEAVTTDDGNESYKLKENIFDSVEPKKVIEHFKKLVENNYITQQNFNNFLFVVFEQNKILSNKIEIIKPNSKSKVQKIFYEYYEKYTDKYGSQGKYIKLLSDNFTGFNFKTLSTNFSK